MTIFLFVSRSVHIGQDMDEIRQNGIDTQHGDDDSRHMVDRQHVARTKPVPEQIQQEGQREPPRHGSAQEPRDGEQSPEKAPHVGHAERRDLEHREEDHDVGDHVDEIRQRDAEHRGEIPPQRRLAHTVAADLRHGVLQEDVDAHDHHDDAAHDAEDQPIRLDRPLQDRREEHGEDRHERIGAGHTEPRCEPRTTTLAQRPLNAEHGYGAYGNGGCDADPHPLQQQVENVRYLVESHERRF